MMKLKARPTILCTGSYLPPLSINNADLAQFPANRVHLIAEKTGILTRRYAGPEQATSDLAAEAGKAALASGGMSAEQIDGIIVATSSPDRIQPATATRVQHLLGASKAWARSDRSSRNRWRGTLRDGKLPVHPQPLQKV